MKIPRSLKPRVIALLTVLATASLLTASEDDLKAKAVLAKYRDCVVSVQAVAELHMSAKVGDQDKASPNRDVPVGGIATIVRSEGVLVSALSYFDPSAMFDGKTVNGPGGKKAVLDVSVGAIKEGKVVMRDGTEIPVEVLLKDATLDLIVLRADKEAWQKAGGDKRASVDLTKAGDAELLDSVLAIGISGPSLGREIVAAPTGIMVKVMKPRVIYRPSFGQKGGPAFLLDGRLLGIGAQHVYHDKLTNDPIIVPTEDVADLVRQALAGKPAQT